MSAHLEADGTHDAVPTKCRTMLASEAPRGRSTVRLTKRPSGSTLALA
jgi:hypothetical protein